MIPPKYTGTPIERMRAKLADLRGLGDAAALIAKPVAKVIDAVAGTDLQNCPPCGQRQEDWNKAMPFHKTQTDGTP
jgi:hypothetical protein